ncbi:MAG: fibronectin type III domain-containing protein [Bacteroidales bacterium]|nr:fibronectin type III domain-containing protein [Bacteroidales bacterium]
MKKVFLCLLMVMLMLPLTMRAQYLQENFESLASGAPTGWTTLSGTVAVYSGTYSCQGSQSLKFSGTLNNMIVLPELTVDISQVEITVNTRPENFTNASCGTFEIGYVTNPSDATTFVPLTLSHYNDFDACFEVSTTFGSAPAGSRIAMRHKPTSTVWYWFVDEVDIHDIPTCPKPVGLTATNITQNSIEFSFTPDSPTQSAWEAVIVAPGDTIDETQVVYLSDTSYEFMDLDGDTPYLIYVRSDCGGEYSLWSQALSVRTSCTDFMTIPYAETFDTYGTTSYTSYPFCWTRLTNYSSQYPYVSSSTPYSTPGNLYFYSTSTSYSYAIAPEVDTITNPINTLTVNFMLEKTSTTSGYGALEVGIMTDPTDISTFTMVRTFTGAELTSGEWMEVEIPLTDYTGYGSYIALRKPASVLGYTYVDNFSVYLTPSCIKPMDVAVSEISANTANISWTPRGDESAWDVVVVEHNGNVEDGIILSATDYPFEVMDLQDNTQYDVYVRANCDNGETSVWSTVVTFITRCLPNSEFPYTENFEAYGTTSYVSFPNCWTRMTNYTSQYPYISSSYNHSGSLGSLYFYSTSSYYSLATTEQMDLSSAVPGSLKLDYSLYKTSASYGRFEVGYMTDASDITTFISLKSFHPSDLENTSVWYDFTEILPEEVYNQPVYFAFYAPSEITSNVYLDGVSINEVPNCSTPSNLAVTNVSGSTAILEWEDAPFGDSDYTLEYAESETGNWTSVTTDGTTYTLTGLSSGTVYDVMLYSNCPETDTVTLSFSTRVFMECMQDGSVTDEITSTTTATAYYVPVSNFFKYCYTQQIYTADEINPTHTPTVITGVAFEYSYSSPTTKKSDVKIYLAHRTSDSFSSTSDWTPISEATLVYEGNLNCTTGWNTFTFDTPFSYNGVDNLVVIVDDNSYGYDGSSYVFNVHTPSTSYMSMYYQNDSSNPDPENPPAGTRYSNRSDIKFSICDQVSEITCLAPVITNAESGEEDITITWIPGMNETSWELEYKAANDTTWTPEGTITSSPYVISNLTSNTSYDIRIKSNCGSGEYSDWATVSSRTVCSFVTVPYTENFESATGSGAAYFVDCWTRGTNNTTTYPYTSSSQSVSGNYSLYFYGTSSNYSYAVSPRFEDSVLMDSLLVQFQAYKTSASYYIEVGIMENPDDYSTFTYLGQFSPSAISTWELGEVRTSEYTGNGHYVAFRTPASISNFMYLDDIYINFIPNCQHVENVHAIGSSITATDAEVTWTVVGDEMEWDVLYGPIGTVDLENDVPTTVYTNSILLDNLTGNTLYEVYVRANCSFGDNSTWMNASFRTACTEITTLPYMDNFDTYGTGTTVYPDCWSKINTYTTSDRPYINTTNYSAPGSMYFYTGTSGTYNIAITPQFDASIAINTLQATFMYRANASTDRLIVGVMTDPTNAATFVPVDTVIPGSTATSWVAQEVLFTDYQGTGQYIAFKNEYTSTTAYAYMDNLSVDLAPGCDAPTDLAAANFTSSTVDLTWNDEISQGSWQIYVCESDSTPDFSQAYAVTSNNYTVTNLNPSTVYTAYVRTICSDGSGYSNWRQVNFMTIGDNPAQIPYFHDFEDATENAEWMLLNTGATNKWHIGQPTEEDNNVLFVSNDGLSETYSISNNSNVWAWRDVQFNNAAEFSLQFNWKAYGEGTTTIYDYLKVYIGNPVAVTSGNNNTAASVTTNDPAGAEVLGVFNLQSNWQTANIILDGRYANTTQRIYFRWNNDGSSGTAPAAVLDSIQITASNCGHPYNVQINNMSSTSFDVTFHPAVPTDNAWEYVVCSTGTNPETQTPNYLGDTTFTVSGLTANTTYDVYVRTDCGGGETSAWEMVTLTTDCDYITIPYTENFDTYGTGSSAYPSCWSNINTYSTTLHYPYVSSSYHTSGTASMYFYNSATATVMAILPPVDVTVNPMNMLQLNLSMRSTTYTSSGLIVGVMSNSADESTFVPIDTLHNTASSVFETFEIPLSNYTGNGSYLALKALFSAATSVYVDDVILDFIPSCPKPTNLVASNATTSSIDLSWTEVGSATSWNIEYGPAGFEQGSGTVITASSNPYTLAGLDASTNYTFYVQSDCGAGDYSPWSVGTTYATACDATSLPYTENFDSYTGTTYNVAGVAPTCWITTTTNSTYPAPHVIGSGSYYYPNSQPNALAFTAGTSGSGQDAYAILPEFTDALNTITMAFAYRMESATYGTMTVGYVTDVDNIATSFNTIATLPNTTAIVLDTVSFATVPASATGRLAFHWNCTGSYYTCNIDDISVFNDGSTPATCDAPTNVTISNLSQTGATVTWTAGSAAAWNVQYKEASASTWSNNIPVTAATYTFSGLTANTQYEVRVQADCGNNLVSDWTTNNFTTLAEDQCPTPTNFREIEHTTTSVTFAWDQEAGTATEWGINYKKTTDSEWTSITVTTNPYTITDLAEGATYEAQIEAHCSNGTNSGATPVISVVLTGVDEYIISNNISLYPNPASNYVDVRVDNEEIQISELAVYDVYGKLLRTINVTENPTRIDISDLSDGMYFVRIISNKGMATKPFVKR